MSKVASQRSIRDMRYEDLEMVLAWRNHPEIRRYMYTQQEITLAEHKAWFKRNTQDTDKHLLIFEFNEIPLGFVNFSRVTNGPISNWGFYVAPEAPKGTGRQLATAALIHAFTRLKLHKICGQALSFNERSIKLHLGLGFQREGILRDQHFDGHTYHDVVCLGLLTSEWPLNA